MKVDMDAYKDMAIKDVITEFPEVGTILAEYDVGCVTCQVGTCLLKDVVAIHDLGPEAETELMARIAEVVSSGAGVAAGQTPSAENPPGAATRETAAGAEITVRQAGYPIEQQAKSVRYSPPMRLLVDEHVLIKRFVALIPAALDVLDANAVEDRDLLSGGIDFIRSYADRFHHAKEEEILFAYFDQTQEIIQAMLADHENARRLVRRLMEAVEARDRDAIAAHLGAYGRLLAAHIDKEDLILYPWMDRQLTTKQVGELFARFKDADQAAGPGFTARYIGWVEQAEKTIESRSSRQGQTTTQKVEARR